MWCQFQRRWPGGSWIHSRSCEVQRPQLGNQFAGKHMPGLLHPKKDKLSLVTWIVTGPMVDRSNLKVHTTNLPVGNPILGHIILGHFFPILGHFGENQWHWGASVGSELHNFDEVTLCQSTSWHDAYIVSKNIYWCRPVGFNAARIWENAIHDIWKYHA